MNRRRQRSNEYSQRRGRQNPPFLQFCPASFPYLVEFHPTEKIWKKRPKCTFLQKGRTWNHYDTLFYIYIYFYFFTVSSCSRGQSVSPQNAPGKMWQNNDNRRRTENEKKKKKNSSDQKEKKSLFLKSNGVNKETGTDPKQGG